MDLVRFYRQFTSALAHPDSVASIAKSPLAQYSLAKTEERVPSMAPATLALVQMATVERTVK